MDPDAVARIAPTLFPNRPAVACIRPSARHPHVWELTLEDGRKLVAKRQPFAPLARGEPYDLLKVETAVCRLLSDCPVPRVYGTHPGLGLIFLEWCGGSTLDDICQHAPPADRALYAKEAVEGFSALQTAFQRHTPELAPRTFPGCGPDGLRRSWRQATAGLPQSLPQLAVALSRPPAFRASQPLAELLDTLGQAPPLLGPTDYNARNIVVDPDARAIRIIELSKLGWDWPERRLVQYTTGLGANRPDGRFHSLLDPPLAARYAALAHGPEAALRRLDGHHLVFHLLAARLLLDALSAPGASPLLNAWQNPEPRLRQLRAILSVPLSDDPLVAELRSLFRM